MSVVFAILLFSFLIFIHELGHFTAAKLSGVRVNEFALFMGPAIFKKQVGETTYSLRLIPFGGFCAMEGEDGESDDSRAFSKASWWKRLIILVAGAAMNFIVGVVLMLIVVLPSENIVVPVIDVAEPGNTIVYEEGLHVGDRILEVDGEKVYVAGDFSMLLALKPGEHHDLVVERDGEVVVLDNFLMQTHDFTEADGTTTHRLGIRLGSVPGNFINSIKYAGNNSINVLRTVRLSLQMLFTGQVGVKELTGPVGLVQMMSDTASASGSTAAALLNMLSFGAFISINLAVMNLLPIPALDGGRVVGLLLVTAIEAITRKKVNPKIEGYIHGIGMILLLALMALILFKDVFMIFKG